jgi:hypothetical protein
VDSVGAQPRSETTAFVTPWGSTVVALGWLSMSAWPSSRPLPAGPDLLSPGSSSTTDRSPADQPAAGLRSAAPSSGYSSSRLEMLKAAETAGFEVRTSNLREHYD